VQASGAASRATIGSAVSTTGSGNASASATGAGTGAAKTVTKRERATMTAEKRILYVCMDEVGIGLS
jgi:hypothetical protein